MNSNSNWPRYLLGAFALMMLIAGGIIAASDLFDTSSREFLSGTLLKVGFVLALAWVASPQLERYGWSRLRGTLLVGVIIVLVLWSIRPRIGAIAGAVLIASSFVATFVGWFRGLTAITETQKKTAKSRDSS